MSSAGPPDGATVPATLHAWPARLPFYYGWVNVAVAAVAMSATLPGRTYGLGLIKEPLRADLGIGDVRFNDLNALAIVLGAAVVYPVGRLIDRLGARLLLVLVAAALGASVIAMSRADDEVELAVALTLVRGLGQGALSVVAIALVGKWFRRRAGVAMGVFAVLLGVGFAATVEPFGAAVREYGWRAAWNGLGLGLLLGLAPLGLLLARTSPETSGVTPDAPAPEVGDAPSLTAWAALRTPAFWAYTAAATAFNLVFSALTLDNELLLNERGLDGATANRRIMEVLFTTGLSANLAAGYLTRRCRLGPLLAVGVFMLAAAMAVFPAVSDLRSAAGYAALLGVSGGFITVVYFTVYGHTYGRAHLGTIQAVVQVLSVFASAAGPALLARVRALNDGHTEPFFHTAAAVSAVLAVAAWVVRPPVREEPTPLPEGKGEEEGAGISPLPAARVQPRLPRK